MFSSNHNLKGMQIPRPIFFFTLAFVVIILVLAHPSSGKLTYSSQEQGIFKIAFISDRGDPNHRTHLWTIKSDGSDLTQVTNFSSPWKIYLPIFSHDGQWIVFLKEDDPNMHRSELWKIKEDGSELILINDPGSQRFSHCYPISWSPDDGSIIFSSEQSNHNGWFELWKINSDGSNATNCSPGEGNAPSGAFSPDGNKIVYAMGNDYYKPSRIATISTDCSNKQLILSDNYWPSNYGPIYNMVWTKQNYIIFNIGTFLQNYGIYKINSDGTGLTKIVDAYGPYLFGGKINSAEQNLSLDESKLVFSSKPTGNYDVYTVNVDGTNPQQLTLDSSDDEYPIFSPDGTKIIWISGKSDTKSIWIMDIDGNNKRQLTDDLGNELDLNVSSKIIEAIKATIDIDPDTLNRKSKGKWITAYIEMPEEYSAGDIDISTVAIVAVDDAALDEPIYAESAPVELDDYDNDGILDLMVKFDRKVLIEHLDAGDRKITIYGSLYNESKFQGSDIIRVIN
jgi:Tol biopolymer transport system component